MPDLITTQFAPVETPNLDRVRTHDIYFRVTYWNNGGFLVPLSAVSNPLTFVAARLAEEHSFFMENRVFLIPRGKRIRSVPAELLYAGFYTAQS